MGWAETLQVLPDTTKVRIVFYPLAFVATQVVSLSHFLLIPDSDYFTTLSVISGIILGSAIIGTAEVVTRYLSQREQALREQHQIVKFAANLLKTHLYALELLPDGEALYKFANDAYRKRPQRAHFRDLSGIRYSEFHTREESAAFHKELAEVLKADQPIEKEFVSRSGRPTKKTLTPHRDVASGRNFVFVVSEELRPSGQGNE